MKIVSDALMAADVGQVTLLGLLDLSAAFDTVDHDILINRLCISFGVRGTALGWIDSFIRKRTQMVNYNGQTSTSSDVECGVPQGSVLGPILFLLYTTDVPNIVQQHELSSHTYADDTQLYAHCKAQSCQKTAVKVIECIKDIDRWMSSNRLKLNGDKTQFIWLGTWNNWLKFSAAQYGSDMLTSECLQK